MKSLQDQYAPNSICFGCGPANEKGLKIKSYPEGEIMKATFRPEPHHHAFPGVVNGGIIGALLDCHSNWTASYYLMKKNKLDSTPCTVTAEFNVKLNRPTPMNSDLKLEAKVLESPSNDKAVVEAKLIANEKVCANCIGTFVSVKPGHPAFHRW